MQIYLYIKTSTGLDITPYSIGIVADDDRSFYTEINYYSGVGPLKAQRELEKWLKTYMPDVPDPNEYHDYIDAWVDHPYTWPALCTLWDGMHNLPTYFNKTPLDLATALYSKGYDKEINRMGYLRMQPEYEESPEFSIDKIAKNHTFDALSQAKIIKKCVDAVFERQ